MSISQKKKKKKMNTFIKTQQDINNIYCPLRTKPKKITKKQWNEAKEHMLESQFINRMARDKFNFNPWPIQNIKKHTREELLEACKNNFNPWPQVSSDETPKPITTKKPITSINP